MRREFQDCFQEDELSQVGKDLFFEKTETHCNCSDCEKKEKMIQHLQEMLILREKMLEQHKERIADLKDWLNYRKGEAEIPKHFSGTRPLKLVYSR